MTDTIYIKVPKAGTLYQPKWADEGERLAIFNNQERLQEAAPTGDSTKFYLICDVWIIDENDVFVGFKTCEYAVKGEDGNGTIWKRCPQGVDFADIEPYEIEPHEKAA